jgi:two-component system nitrogen regulation sensor histidine kinase NtrY
MRPRVRILSLIIWLFVAACFIIAGTYFETKLFNIPSTLNESRSFASIALFFSIVNLNVIFLFLFVFLVFRNGVKLAVDRRRGVFGSSLRTKLVSSFLFFSLLPTVILLYISTKFVNASFEKWLPESLVTTMEQSRHSEADYQNKILKLLKDVDANEEKNYSKFDFIFQKSQADVKIINKTFEGMQSQIEAVVLENENSIGKNPQWYSLNKNRLIALVAFDKGYAGIVSPLTIHPRWQLLSTEFSGIEPGVEILRGSYVLMLGVLTLLIVFSATWLGFTIAREFTIPIQALASATELVAQGNYHVTIDDVVSNDEIGRLALSFRSMVTDLRKAKDDADSAAGEIKKKAEELFEKSEYNTILLRNVNAAVISLNEEGYVESWNHQAELLFQVSELAALGQQLDDVLEEHFFREAILPLFKELHSPAKNSVTGDFAGRVRNNDVQFSIAVSEVFSNRARLGTVIFVNDFTELARAQRHASWREVVRRIAHEIKNPLTPIKLGAERLNRRFETHFHDKDLEVFQQCIKVILHSTESIKGLVDEFVKFARMPSSVLQQGNYVEAIQIAVASFAENSERVPVLLEIFEKEGSIEKRWHATESSFPEVMGKFDKTQIIRLFVNLISNAVAASLSNMRPVIVRVHCHKEGRLIVAEVIDCGVGVSDEVKQKIFEPYFSTKRTGTGLGLVIVKQIMSEHKGNISFEDNVPCGSIFRVEFPLD